MGTILMGDRSVRSRTCMEPSVIHWMMTHSIDDVCSIADALENKGSDVAEIRSFIDDLRLMAREVS